MSIEEKIEGYCEGLKQRMLEKFRRGREEHGEDLTSLDIQKEINNEVLDILNYHLIAETVQTPMVEEDWAES